MALRYRIDPADIHPEKAARRLGLTLPEFETQLPRLLSRGFPAPDMDTGMYDLEAIDRWRRRRHPHLFPEQASVLTAQPVARDAADVVGGRIARLRARG
ncbi:hypothetical protein [Rhodoligotrophos defluvii]|uniref:hypothetical protein n=1 Tax=Rhodoligotrophos defluvii TaxID=2561934 RepID=UPI0010C93782|nr:hypothetical protein [Rhodoligotrophos defluvii]